MSKACVYEVVQGGRFCREHHAAPSGQCLTALGELLVRAGQAESREKRLLALIEAAVKTAEPGSPVAYGKYVDEGTEPVRFVPPDTLPNIPKLEAQVAQLRQLLGEWWWATSGKHDDFDRYLKLLCDTESALSPAPRPPGDAP